MEFQKLPNFVLPMLTPGYTWVPSKNVSQFGPAVWPTIANISEYERRALLYRYQTKSKAMEI